VIDERELRRLAGRERGIPPVGDVVRRGRQIQRVRRVRRGIAALSSVAAIIGAVAVLSRAVSDSPTVEMAAPVDLPAGAGAVNGDTECGGYAESRGPDEATVPRLMPDWLPPGLEVGHAWARAELTDRRTCPAVPTALVAVRHGDGGVVSAAVRVEGPSPEPYRQYSGPSYEPVIVRMDDEAQLVRFPVDASILQVQWTEPDGTSWSMTSQSLDAATLLAVAANLELRGLSGSPVARLPEPVDAIEEVWRLEQLPGEPPSEEPFWHVVIDDGQTLSIDVSRPLVPSPAISAVAGPGSTLLEVRGHPAVAFDNGSASSVWLVWDEEPGLRVSLSGSLDLETLKHIAESLAPAPPDDPRISPP
jgi:hypothetical protein